LELYSQNGRYAGYEDTACVCRLGDGRPVQDQRRLRFDGDARQTRCRDILDSRYTDCRQIGLSILHGL
jgi:hypothetical protein